MAADNSLADKGVEDIDEMESAPPNPDVQVVVQAEFSPVVLAQYGCSAACANRPNLNTFRYRVTGTGPHVVGPDGAATDIGNRNMVDPGQLQEFIQWGKTTYPAERYAVILWNHGGGYAGLLEDKTSAGEALMPLSDLHTALSGTGPIDVLDFDMCLMASYEALAEIDGSVKYAVFSEELEPGNGDPYDRIVGALGVNPTADTRSIAAMFVDEYDSSYANSRASTTKSAYDLSGFSAFEASLSTLAGTLQAEMGTLGPSIGAAAAVSQKYSYPWLTDVGNFLDSLAVRTTDTQLLAQIAAAKSSAVGAGFRVETRARTGAGQDAADVSRSTGLTILMPSGQPFDALPDQGSASFASYEALYPDKPWTQFLASWLASATTVAYVDQGDNRFESYLVWDSAAVSRGADVDLWILEPDGNLYIPWMGTITPDGHLTQDSYDGQVSFEGYVTNRYLQVGRYKFYANLWLDPNDFRPIYDLSYRNSPSDVFASLYSPNFPTLSTQVSWLDDPSADFTKVESGAYTDLQYVAFLDIALPVVASTVGEPVLRAGMTDHRQDVSLFRRGDPMITTKQLDVVRRMHAQRPSIRQVRPSVSRPHLRPHSGRGIR
jgi:hypothetical protein